MIAFYRGLSPVSRAIRWRTWSPFSHVSWIVDPNRTYAPSGEGVSEIEAWRRGVTETPGIGGGHTPGTPIDLYDVDQLGDVGRGQVAAWLRNELGKRYDFRAIFGFVIRWDRAQRADRWFCSELLFSACDAVGYPLLSRIAAHRVDPGMLNISPRLRFIRTVYSSGALRAAPPAGFEARPFSANTRGPA